MRGIYFLGLKVFNLREVIGKNVCSVTRWFTDIKSYPAPGGGGYSDIFIHRYTPASNLGYLAPPPPQDNFSWVPNCSLGPPGWETKVSSKKFWFGLCEIAWFLCQPIANLRRGVCL